MSMAASYGAFSGKVPRWSRRLPGRLAGAGTQYLAVALGVGGLPAPAVAAHLLEAELALPAELTRGQRRFGKAFGGVARAARVELERHRSARRRHVGLHCLEHGVAASAAEIRGN